MFAYTVSEREEGSNVFKLIDKIDIGNYNYMYFVSVMANKNEVKTSALCVGKGVVSIIQSRG